MGMQATIRLMGGATMKESDHRGFIKAHTDGTLVKPEDAGHVIAKLALHAPKILSGKFVSWDSEECADYRRKD
ncbi:hypothetical protein HWV62_42235 [Athelia sp. TMB]|nr:hypothetical protein HWV62_42235 [Athelia sp. TMB]